MNRFASFLVVALALMARLPAAHAQGSPSDLVTRVDRMEETIRDLTGRVEQLQYRNQQLEQEVQRLQQGMAGGARSSAVATPPLPPQGPPQPTARYAAQALPPPPTAQYVPQALPPPPVGQYPPQGLPPPTYPAPIVAPEPTGAATDQPQSRGRGDAFDPNLNPNAPGVPHPLGSATAATEPPPPVPDDQPGAPERRQPGAPLDLSSVSTPQGGGTPAGVLPPPPPANPNATGAMQATLPPTNSPRDEYDLAYGYYLHKDYGPAAAAFNDFLRKYPSERLTPEAQYWLGEALFQSQNYHDAAEAFLTVSTKYDTSARAPDALLRLGESLAALGEKEAACASLGEVLRKYPRASLSVKQSVDREQKRAHC